METVLRNLTEGLLDRSCEVTVLTAGDGPLDKVEVVTGPDSGRTGRLLRGAVYGHINSQPLTLSLMSLMRQEMARFDPDLVHLHLPNPLAAAAWLSLKATRLVDLPPLAVWYHADITRQRVGRWLVRPLVDACLEQADGISVSSAALASGSPVLARWREKVEEIPFGIDPSPWTDIEPGLDGPFLFVGRLVHYKGLEILLEALALVPGAQAVIIGEGPLEFRLKALAAELGLDGRVVFAGPMDQGGVAVHLARARALVLPSVNASETFGLVQLEAMAAAVPVIASDLPTGIREVGEPGRTGLLVPPGNAAALAAAMASFLDDPAAVRAMGIAGRRRFNDRFTREIMIDKLLDWYQRLVAPHPGDVL
jgi:glycosyltransferase involved in cell wall biosynthesis